MRKNPNNQQLPLFGNLVETTSIVNVASVPQRSVFRYPGGKTWFVPNARRWLASLPKRPSMLIEPFAGGGIVGLTAGFEDLADHIILIELDPEIAAVWKTILSDDAPWLGNRITEFILTAENVNVELERTAPSLREVAFQTILRNRINRGGIMAPGAGKIKTGENGRGLDSRWYPETLSRRIMDIYQIRDKFSFVEGNAFDVISQYIGNSTAAFFVDPPYTAGGKRAGSRLYTHSQIDHVLLFSLLSRASGNVLITYDDAQEVRDLAVANGFVWRTIPMKNTHHSAMKELVISQDMSWLDS